MLKHISSLIEFITELGRRDARVEYWLTEDELHSERFILDPWYGITTAINRHCAARWAITFVCAASWVVAVAYYLVTK